MLPGLFKELEMPGIPAEPMDGASCHWLFKYYKFGWLFWVET